MSKDDVNKPAHYTAHPSGVECIEITEHMNFCLGNAFKYIWRAGLKTDDPLKDLQKARWYIDREIGRLTECASREKRHEALDELARIDQELDLYDSSMNPDLNFDNENYPYIKNNKES